MHMGQVDTRPAPPAGPSASGAPQTPVAGPDVPTPIERSNLWALARLLFGVSAVVALFVLTGGGDLLIVIVLIIIMVMVHELGHFATAKWAKMKVTEYFVGFGPRLWSIRRGETDYGVKPILAGGYVKIPGMTNLEEIDPADEPRTYRQQPIHKRIIVASAGSFMHFVMAFVLAWIAVVAFGIPSAKGLTISGFVQWNGHSENAAQLGGLKVGDTVVTVNGKPVVTETVKGKTVNSLTTAINDSPGQPVHVVVERGGQQVALSVTPALGHSYADGTETIGTSSAEKSKGTPVGLIGISTNPTTTSEGPLRAVGTSVIDVGRVTSATFSGLGTVFSPHGISNLFTDVTNSQAGSTATKNGTRVESIVGAVRTATQAEQAGVLALIEVLIALNIVIGIVNMLPMLPLDGGHVAIAVYERIRTKKGQPYYVADAAKLLPVAYAFVAVLLVIVGSAVYLDIVHPMANPFH